MKSRYFLAIFSLALSLIFSAPSFALGPVWKVTSGDNSGHYLFIGGTIHLLEQQDYPLPRVFERGYNKAHTLVFEIDPDIVKSPKAQQLFAQYSTYRNGQTLDNVLDKETYIDLNNFLAVRGIPIESFRSIKPSMLSVMLTIIELQRLGLAGMGVDEFYNQKAKRDDKPRYSLETLEDQFNAMLAMGKGQENQIIRHTLKELERLSAVMEKTKAAWRKGDNKALIDVALTPWAEQFPSLYTALLVERNQRWLPKIEDFIRSPEVEYILVGALHLAGPDSVLAMLKAKGYRVQQLTEASPP
ncbi:MAG: TraB/GumN family protein [Cellvibrionaceae bacterium]